MPLSVEAQKAVEWIESHYEDWAYRRVVDDWDVGVINSNGEWVYRDVPGLVKKLIPGVCENPTNMHYAVRRDMFETLADTSCNSDGYCGCWLENPQTVSREWTQEDEHRFITTGYIYNRK